MKTTLNEIRVLIREVLENVFMDEMRSVIKSAMKISDAVKKSRGEISKNLATFIQKAAETSAELNDQMKTSNHPNSMFMININRHLQSLAKETGFFARPVFFGKDEHTNKVLELVRLLDGTINHFRQKAR